MELRLAVILASWVGGCTGFKPQTVFDDGGVPQTPQVLAEHRTRAQDLAVRGGFVYWVEQGSYAMSGHDGQVLRAPIDGCKDTSCPTVLAHDIDNASGITLSLDGKTLYFCANGLGANTGSVWQIALGGDETPYIFADKQDGTRKVAVDDTALYWINGNSGELHRAWLDGSDMGIVIDMLRSPVELKVDVASQRVFFTEYGGGDFSGMVSGADITGTNLFQIAKAQSQPRGFTLGTTNIYWANFGNGTVMRAGLDGTDVGAFASERRSPSDVLIAGDWLFVAESGTAPYYKDGRIAAMKLDGTETRVLADSQAYPRSLAIDDKAVYWVNSGTYDSDMYDASVMRVAQP